MNQPKILIAVPLLDKVHTEFMASLMGLQRIGHTQVAVEINSLVYMARNRLALKAIEGGYDYILWIDSDMSFSSDTLVRLYEDIKDGRDYVTGIFFRRSFPTEPVVCKHILWGRNEETGMITREADAYLDYPRDSLFEVDGSGLGCTLVSVDLIKEVVKHFAMSAFEPLPAFGEDFSFCWRVKQLGKKMWCDSRVKVGHLGLFTYDEMAYFKQLKEGDL